MFRISADLTLPVEAVTETFAVLAKRGKGKTYLGAVLAEEMVNAGHPVVILDPVGVWWGLRSSASGTDTGLPVVIFGGDHADIPLDEHAADLLADVIVDQRIAAVIDLSGLSKSAGKRFTGPFLERLYHRNREPLHVIVDEADVFAPQRAQAEGLRLLGAMEDLVRRGRARGIGVTLITQRPAVLHKDVLTQAEVLVALGMTGPRDVAAIDEWVRLHADEEQARDLKRSLPSLPTGTAWVWSPGWLDTLARIKIRKRLTFDSSATPKPGQKRREPKRMADVDIAALGEKIAARVEQAKADDPRTLKARIRELERELADTRAEWEDEIEQREPERVEVPVITEDMLDRFSLQAGNLMDTLGQMESSLDRFRKPVEAAVERPRSRFAEEPLVAHAPPPRPRPATSVHSLTSRGDGRLPKAQRAILTVLAQYGERTVTQTALLAGYSANGGGYRNALGALRTAGYIEGKGDLKITDAGHEALGPYEPLPTGRALIEHHAARLPKAAREILDVLTALWPEWLPAEDIARRTASDYAPNGGGFRNALGRLRTLELVETRDGLNKAADVLVRP